MGLFTPKPKPLSPDATAAFRLAMRRLWTDHVVWTREYIVAAVAGTPDAGAAAARLLRNQTDIGAAAGSYYGPDAGAALSKLLTEHVTIAVDLVAAAKAGDKAAFGRHDSAWSDNGSRIARLLASANPHWPEADLRELIELHLTLTKREAVARLSAKWEDDVSAFDDILTEAMTIADALAAGIVKQFPDRFAEA